MAKIDVYEIVRDRIIGQLEAGSVPWSRPWASRQPVNAISKRPYRGINLFLLPVEKFSDNRWVSFKQAGELGGSVRKGEKSSIVVFWKILENEDEATGKRRIVPLLRYYNVFNVEQCDGLTKLPAIERSLVSPDDAAEALVAAMPNRPEIRFGGDQAYYMGREDRIQLPARETFNTTSGYYATLFHELTHSTGHSSRTNRHAEQEGFAFGCADYSKEELAAEFGAAFLCAETGVSNESTERNSAAYIGGWLKALQTSDRRFLISAASKAQAAVTYIKGTPETATGDSAEEAA